MMGRRLSLAAAAMVGGVVAATAAHAAPVFTNGFNFENGGAPADNYTPGGFTVTAGSVDYLRHGASGVSCAGDFGGCIDLEGAAGYGMLQLESGHAFAVKTGDRVTLEFDLSGNQRGGDMPTADRFIAGFLFSTPLKISGATTGAWPSSTFAMPSASGGYAMVGEVLSDAGFSHYSLSFIAPQNFDLRFRIGGRIPVPAAPSDGVGPILDNVRLDITSTVSPTPEPSTWAMILLGFGGLGAMLRRRRTVGA